MTKPKNQHKLPDKDKCPTCGTEYKDFQNKKFIDRIGECARCDHVRGDL